MSRELCLSLLVEHCLAVHEERSVLNVPGLLVYPQDMYWTIQTLAESITNKWELSSLGGLFSPDFGGSVFSIALQQYLMMTYFVHIPVYRFTKRGRLESPLDIPSSKNVIIIDDVLTTGTAITPIINILKQKNISLVGVHVVVNRPEGGGSQRLKHLDIPFFSIFEMEEILSLHKEKHCV